MHNIFQEEIKERDLKYLWLFYVICKYVCVYIFKSTWIFNLIMPLVIKKHENN